MTQDTDNVAPVLDLPNDAQHDPHNGVDQALLRITAENLKTNRAVVPIFAIAICAIFVQWVSLERIGAWYAQTLLSYLPQIYLLSRLPRHGLSKHQVRRWSGQLAAANLLFVSSWASLGWYFWAHGNQNPDHILIQLILAATLGAHAATTAASPTIARPALLLYLIVLSLVPLQGLAVAQSVVSSLCMAVSAPIYILFIALLAKRNYLRARAAALLSVERDMLLSQLISAKYESDLGRQRAEAASLAKSQFLANMSHELRTPLNAILGFSELISARLFQSQPERVCEYAALINESGKHLLALINDILDLAKIEAGRWKLEESEIDLYQLTTDVLQIVSWRAQDGKARLENAIAEDSEMLFADPRAIKQILLNLLSNALKFTPENGRIRVFAHCLADDSLALGVSDTGMGIAEADQACIFDSFGQGKHDVAIAEKGTGLGLAIVKGLVEAHGGQVRLESMVGKGTCVRAVMPASRVRRRKSPRNEASLSAA